MRQSITRNLRNLAIRPSRTKPDIAKSMRGITGGHRFDMTAVDDQDRRALRPIVDTRAVGQRKIDELHHMGGAQGLSQAYP